MCKHYLHQAVQAPGHLWDLQVEGKTKQTKNKIIRKKHTNYLKTCSLL